jgi:hypothetical protein
MSRFTSYIQGNRNLSLNFGFDHALGYFYDVFDEVEEYEVVSKSSLFNHLTGLELAAVIEEKLGEKANRFQVEISKMSLDLPF